MYVEVGFISSGDDAGKAGYIKAAFQIVREVAAAAQKRRIESSLTAEKLSTILPFHPDGRSAVRMSTRPSGSTCPERYFRRAMASMAGR